jgi:hypothetical protein
VPSTRKSEASEIREAGAPEDAAVEAGLPTAAEKRAAEEQSARHEPRFSRERVLGPEGEQIAGHPVYVIAGALHGDDSDEFTRAQLERKISDFLQRPVQQEG